MNDDCNEKLEELIHTAFPEGDIEGHHNYHKLLIEKAEEEKKNHEERQAERKQITLEIKKKVASGFVWAALALLVSVLASKIGVHIS